MSRPKFWMVYGLHRGAPTARHKTEESAIAEASRLAKKCPGDIFFVLEAVRMVVKREVDVLPLDEPGPYDDDIPF